MGRESKFRGTFGLSPQPVAGVSLYGDKKAEPTLEEVIEKTEKDEVLSARDNRSPQEVKVLPQHSPL